MFSWDVNVVAVSMLGVVIIVQGVSIIVYLVKTNGRAVSAHERADAAWNYAAEAHEKIALAVASISLVREQYVHDDDLRAMEARLTAAINKVGDRLDHALDKRLPK